MRGTRLSVTREKAITFARTWAEREGRKRSIYYHLEYPNGGAVPIEHSELLLGQRTGEAPTNYDCVGAVFAILGCDRVQGPPWNLYFDKKLGYGYVNCDTAIQDADGDQVLFESVGRPGEAPVRAGDLVVFGRKFPGRHGHIGFLSGGAQVIHCSPSNSKKLGHALAETSAEIFLARKDRRYIRYRHWAG